MYFLNGKYMTGEPQMGEVARDPAVLERLRAQRGRLADRMRPPWWYLTGIAIMYGLVFACPFGQRYVSQGFSIWFVFVAGLAVTGLLGWGLPRATGMKGFRNSPDRPGSPVRIATLAACLAALVAEHLLIDRGLPVAAIVAAALGVAVEVACQQAAFRGIRRELRGGGEAA
jgi:hypothetical protein